VKYYLINLKRAEDRLAFMTKQFHENNIQFERIEAVDGRLLTPEEIEAKCDMNSVRSSPKWLTPGMLACCMSHSNTYKKAIDDNVGICCILEDDVKIYPDFSAVVNKLETVIKDGEIILIYFSAFNTVTLSKNSKVHLLKDYYLYDCTNTDGIMSAAAYMMTENTLKTFLSVYYPIRTGSDSWLDYKKYGAFSKIRCVYPRVAHPNYFKSTIDYLDTKSLKSKISAFIEKYKVPIAYQIVRYKRKKYEHSIYKVKFVN
jgi:glycosyl transferase family 25